MMSKSDRRRMAAVGRTPSGGDLSRRPRALPAMTWNGTWSPRDLAEATGHVEALGRLPEIGVTALPFAHESLGLFARHGDQAGVKQAGHQQSVVTAVLGPGRAEHVTRATDLEVALGQVEAAAVTDHR